MEKNMSEFEQLVETIRRCVKLADNCNGCSFKGESRCVAKLMERAAEAIETLEMRAMLVEHNYKVLLISFDDAVQERFNLINECNELRNKVCELSDKLCNLHAHDDFVPLAKYNCVERKLDMLTKENADLKKQVDDLTQRKDKWVDEATTQVRLCMENREKVHELEEENKELQKRVDELERQLDDCDDDLNDAVDMAYDFKDALKDIQTIIENLFEEYKE